jgi:5-(hydroxymethyl)furfural/furfural oxidase
MTTGRAFDCIIVGAGTAGCVVAGRISSDPGLSVLLLEAGADLPPGRVPASVRDCYSRSFGDPRFFWPNLIAEVGAVPPGGGPASSRPFPQARILGGGSSIHGMVALRGLPADYDEWVALGATGWSWREVLPYFCRLERDLDFAGPLHGSQGSIPIRRHPAAGWAPLCRAAGEVLTARGFPLIHDLNGDFRDGVGPVPMSNLPSGRVSSVDAYLGADVRRRNNLHIQTDTLVERVLCEGRSAHGVVVRTARGVETVHAREIVICAGAIHSPALLMRSGIGAGQALQDLEIPVVADVAGVGGNLMNHTLLTLAVYLPARSQQALAQRGWGGSALRYSSGVPGCPAGDMMMVIGNKSSWHALGRRIGVVGVTVHKPFSRGSVQLRSADPAVTPQVKFRFLSDERDRERLIKGLGLAASMLAADSVARVRDEVFVPDMALVRRLNRPRLRSRFESFVLASVLSSSGRLRRRALHARLLDVAQLAQDAAAQAELVQELAGPTGHVAGTCRMGRTDDKLAVVDSRCRVHHVERLRVIDGSVMPTLVCANTNLPITMIAEKAADTLLAELRPVSATEPPRDLRADMPAPI